MLEPLEFVCSALVARDTYHAEPHSALEVPLCLSLPAELQVADVLS